MIIPSLLGMATLRDTAAAYIGFMVVSSVGYLPLVFLAFLTIYFGLLYTAAFCVAMIVYSYLETTYHPLGVTGRRWDSFIDLIAKVWEPFVQMKKMNVVKLGEYPATGKYMFCCHPHGMIFLGAASVFAFNMKKYFPGIQRSLMMHSTIFITPLVRHFCIWLGAIPATKDSALKATKAGNSLALIPGGIAEVIYADSRIKQSSLLANGTLSGSTDNEDNEDSAASAKETSTNLDKENSTENATVEDKEKPATVADKGDSVIENSTFEEKSVIDKKKSTTAEMEKKSGVMDKEKSRSVVLYLNKRKGFVKLAMELGMDLVPVFTFGEIENFHQLQWGLETRIKMSRKFRIPFVFFYGKYGPIPFDEPLTVLVGTPIKVVQKEHPTEKDVEILHGKYCAQLVSMFEENKEKYGYSDTKLILM